MGADPLPFAPSSGFGGSGDPVDNLQKFVDLISGVSGRLIGWQENLATLGVELEGKVDEDGAVLTHARERLEHFEEELQESGQQAVTSVEHLAERAEAVGGQQLPAATGQIVHLDSAVEARTSHAINDLQVDADALDRDGYDALKTTCDAAEQGVSDAQQSLDAGLGAFGQELEDTTRLVESTGAAAADEIDQHAQAVGTAAHAFSAAAADATRVWSEELPPLVNDAVAERKREVEELYQAFDEAEVEGYAQFEAGLDKVMTEAHQSLAANQAALEKSVKHAQEELQRQSDESTKTLGVAESGASSLSGLDGGSFVSHLDYAMDVVGTIDALLKAM